MKTFETGRIYTLKWGRGCCFFSAPFVKYLSLAAGDSFLVLKVSDKIKQDRKNKYFILVLSGVHKGKEGITFLSNIDKMAFNEV